MKNKPLRAAAKASVVLCTLLLVACGGGSDDDGTTPLKPAISEETARLRRMGLPEGAATPAANSTNTTGINANNGTSSPGAVPTTPGLGT